MFDYQRFDVCPIIYIMLSKRLKNHSTLNDYNFYHTYFAKNNKIRNAADFINEKKSDQS